MDRRTALAFGLMALVIIGFSTAQYFLFPPEPVPQEEQIADTDGGPRADQPDAAGNETPARADDPVPSSRDEYGAADTRRPVAPGAVPGLEQALRVDTSGPEEAFTVETPLYVLRISSIGGRIVSFETKEHLSHTGELVQLIPEDIAPTGNDALLFRNGELPLGKANYRFEGPSRTLNIAEGEHGTVLLHTDLNGGLRAEKIYTFHADEYGMDVSQNLAMSDPDLARETLNVLGSPEDFRFGWNQGIAPTERIQKLEEGAMRSIARVGDETHTKKRQGLKKDVEKVTGLYRGTVHYAGVQNKYFTVFGIVDDETSGAVEGAVRLGGDQDRMAQSWAMDIPALRGTGDQVAQSTVHMFIGPATVELVTKYGHKLDGGIDLGMRFIRPLSEAVLWLLNWMHQFIPNYGVIIIIFSLMTKALFYRLTKKQTESMKKMQDLKPKLDEIQKKYKNDKEKLNQATMKLYQDEGVNPLAGCLPLLVQMPIFFALYQGLSNTVALRGQPFVGWISDLSQPDALFQLPFSLPFLGNDFNVLPILMALAMYYQSKVAPTPSAGGQMAMMTTMMPLFMVFIFYNMPSGLVLYWLVNTILQVWQSWKIHRAADPDGGAVKA
jgi:YidC/Oxa1 family membrane protein insertase